MIKSKKFRKININGEVYGWMVKETFDYLIVHIETYCSDGGKLDVYVELYSRSIQPKDIRNMILFAVKNGWNPEDKLCVKEYILYGEDLKAKRSN